MKPLSAKTDYYSIGSPRLDTLHCRPPLGGALTVTSLSTLADSVRAVSARRIGSGVTDADASNWHTDRVAAFAALDVLHTCYIIHGDARGADRLCRDWAVSRGIPHEAYPADWGVYGKAAGAIRNGHITVWCFPVGVVRLIWCVTRFNYLPSVLKLPPHARR